MRPLPTPEAARTSASSATATGSATTTSTSAARPATQFKARVASGAPAGVSGLVQVRLGSPTGQVLGSFAVANTGGWQSWRTVPANISGVTGRHTVYITFSSGQPADFVNLNWFTFSS
ncbi:carbohydrate-binding protein [Actinomadura madurae]|nr:carbohydrate-binding protein [Actinomadura madurae]MCP9977632.1 carbohydrate-binding protein [Actinomadura madurae]